MRTMDERLADSLAAIERKYARRRMRLMWIERAMYVAVAVAVAFVCLAGCGR